MRLEYANYVLEKNQGQTNQDLIGYLQSDEKNILKATEEEGKYKIDVEKLLNKKLELGMGTDKKDVYMLEEITEELGTRNIGKIASIKITNLADNTLSSIGKKYKVMYYGNVEDENREIEVLEDKKVRSQGEEKNIKTIEELKAGEYINVPYNGNFIKCIVLYDKAYDDNLENEATNFGIQVVTADTVGENVELEASYEGWTNAVLTLNNKAREYINESNNDFIYNARSVGFCPDPEDKELELNSYDCSSLNDEIQMQALGIFGIDKSKEYWIARHSARLLQETFLDWGLEVCVWSDLDSSYDTSLHILFAESDEQCENGSYGLRPVFTLKPEVKVVGKGEKMGTKENPYELTK